MLSRELHPAHPRWMADLEDQLTAGFATDDALIYRAVESVVRSRGKRLRPLVLFLSCACFGEVPPRAIRYAALLEQIHAASLAHDDVIDEATYRRGELSTPARWGSKLSVLLGDYLLTRVYDEAIAEGDVHFLRIISQAATRMSRAVILELTQEALPANSTGYWEIVAGKTAGLFAAAAEIGAHIGYATAAEQHALQAMGLAFGCAYQLADDVLDLQGSPADTGKAVGIDWRQRRATLPLITALQRAPHDAAAEIRRLWQLENCPAADFRLLQQLIDVHGGFEDGWHTVKEYQQRAEQALTVLPAGTGRTALERLCCTEFPLPVMPNA